MMKSNLKSRKLHLDLEQIRLLSGLELRSVGGGMMKDSGVSCSDCVPTANVCPTYGCGDPFTAGCWGNKILV